MKTVLFPLICFLAGCHPPGSTVVEQTIEQVYPLTHDGTVRIHNLDGSIHIYGSDINEVKLEALKKAYTQERLDKISVSASADPGTVSIESIFPPTSRWDFSDRSGTIDYTLLVPQHATIEQAETANGEIIIEGMRGAKANARLGNGRLFVRDSFCNLGLTIGHGSLSLTYTWWERGRLSVDANLQQGNTTVFMPGNATFHLKAETKTGKIGADFTPYNERNGEEPRKIDKVVGPDPTVTFQIHTIDGNIQVSEQNP